MEAVAGNPVMTALLDEVRDPRIRIRRVRDGHRRGAEAERPFRRESLTAGQPGKAAHHVRHAGPCQDVVVEVAVLGAVGAKQAVIIVDGAAEIHLAGRDDCRRTRRARPSFPSTMRNGIIL